jgi:SAM-dependent methyltransferase
MFKHWLGRARVRLVYALAYGVKEIRERGFFAGGFWPPLPQLVEVPALRQARSQANLYELALRHLPGPRPEPRAVLDIGCGAGGGLIYAHAIFPAARLVGVDVNGAALKTAWERLAKVEHLELRLVSGDRTRLPPHSFDVIVGIGCVNAIGPSELLSECARLLAPGGVVSLTAAFALTPSQVQELFNAAAWQAGLVLRQVSEITEGTRAALAHDRPWAEAVIAKVPAPLRSRAREMAALPGTRTAKAMAEGRLRSYAILVDHPVAAWDAPRLRAA